MKIIDCIQGSVEWFEARAGIPTASGYSRITTPSGKPSESADKYMDELLAEYMAGTSLNEGFGNYWTRRGTRLEPDAREEYSFASGMDVEQPGFCTLDDGSAGYSPDGFVGEGLLELKCPKPETMISYYKRGFPLKYKPQCQGGLWITGKPWIDFYCYHPKMKAFYVRIERDEPYINALFSAVSAFNIKLREAKKELERWKV